MDADPTFAGLLARLRQGDTLASEELVKRYEPEVRRFVRYRLNSPKMRRLLDSVDVSQSVFAEFFVRLADGQFDLTHPRQLQQLLRTMAGNKVIDHARKQAALRRGGAAAPAPVLDGLADSAAGPSQAAEANDLVDVVRSRLSGEEGTMLDQWMNGEGWQAMAERCGTSAEAVRKRFTRALDRVAGELGWGGQP